MGSASQAPPNDPQIGDSTALWRRIHPTWFVWDENIGRRRVSSQAFDNSRDGSGTSVVIATESTLRSMMAGYDSYGLAELTAGSARALRQGVRRVPLDGVDGHAQIEGTKTTPVKRGLANASRVLIDSYRADTPF
jgi:hypothetical protein